MREHKDIMGASADADRAGRASPEPAGGLGHSATIPSAVVAAIWRCGVGVGVEATDRVVAAFRKKTRSRAVFALCEELDRAMQAVVDETRKPVELRAYRDAFDEHKRIQKIIASAIEAASATDTPPSTPTQEPQP